MLHLCKLSVGVRDVAQLRALQASRPLPLCHRTRNQPRRRAEVLAGGSIYWVVAGVMLVRQPILDIQTAQWEDGSPCAALVLDPDLVAVSGRPVRAFQGWRYLEAADAPPDLSAAMDEYGLPEAMLRELRILCLI